MSVHKVVRLGSSFMRDWVEEATLACSHPRAGRLDRYTRLALAAAQQLVPLIGELGAREGLGIFFASEFGCFGSNCEHLKTVRAGQAASPLVFPATVPSSAAGEVAMSLLAMGPNVTLTGGVEVALQVWALARAALAAGDCEQALVGVVEAWHPRLAEFGLSFLSHDGACLALLERL